MVKCVRSSQGEGEVKLFYRIAHPWPLPDGAAVGQSHIAIVRRALHYPLLPPHPCIPALPLSLPLPLLTPNPPLARMHVHMLQLFVRASVYVFTMQ